MNETFLKLWILTEVSKLDQRIKTCETITEGFEIRGKLDLLHKMFEDFCLSKVEEPKELQFHNEI